MKPEPRLCNVWRIWRGRIRSYPKNCAYTSSKGSRTVRRTTRSVLMFTTAGNTLATAKTAGSDAGSACAKQDVHAATTPSATASTRSRIHVTRALPGVVDATFMIALSFRHQLCLPSKEAAPALSTCRTAQSLEIDLLCVLQLTLAKIST